MKALQDFFSRLTSQKQAEAQTAEEIYQNLVVALADGTMPDGSESLSILGDAGKSPEDLQRDVNRLIRRRELHALLQTEPEAREQLHTVERQVQESRDRYQEAQRRFQHEMSDLAGARNLAGQKLAQIEDARAELLGSANPEIIARQSAVGRLIRPIHDRLLRAREELKSEIIKQGHHSPEVAETAKQKCTELRREISELESKVAASEKQQSELGQEALTP